MQVLTKTGSSSRCPVFQMIGCSGWSGGSQQTGVPTPPAAKSAPLRKRGWRPSVQQSKLNHQMCLCSKYLSPAGYYWCLIVSGHIPSKKTIKPFWCGVKSQVCSFLSVWTHDPPTKSSQSTEKKSSKTHFSMLDWETSTIRADVLLLSSGIFSSEAEATLLPSSSAPNMTSHQIPHYWAQWKT